MTVTVGLGIAMAFAQMLLGVLGTLIWARDKERREEVLKLRTDFDRLRGDLPKTFVFKDDYVRSQIQLERSVEGVHKAITEVRDLLVDHLTREERSR